MDHLARRSRKTEANRETERESQDEPIVDKSNAHGARGEILRGLVRSRVGHVVPTERLRSPPVQTGESGLAVRASYERDLGTVRARDLAVSGPGVSRPSTRLETAEPPSRFAPLRRAPPFPPGRSLGRMRNDRCSRRKVGVGGGDRRDRDGLVNEVVINFRPGIGRDHPPNLSISLSGGKETKRDTPSNGERKG